jgi:hypothetical protein
MRLRRYTQADRERIADALRPHLPPDTVITATTVHVRPSGTQYVRLSAGGADVTLYASVVAGFPVDIPRRVMLSHEVMHEDRMELLVGKLGLQLYNRYDALLYMIRADIREGVYAA